MLPVVTYKWDSVPSELGNVAKEIYNYRVKKCLNYSKIQEEKGKLMEGPLKNKAGTCWYWRLPTFSDGKES